MNETAKKSHGLSIATITALNGVFSKYPSIEKAILYGSRAKGNHRANSDIDITLQGYQLSMSIVSTIETDIDDLLLPYKIDMSIYHLIENRELIEHIDRVGICIYET